jgi:hypothetical protein
MKVELTSLGIQTQIQDYKVSKKIDDFGVVVDVDTDAIFDKELGISKEIITKRTNNGYGIGKVSAFYFINNDDREFTDIDKFIEAYNEKFKFEFENPQHQVTYVRVVKLKEKV